MNNTFKTIAVASSVLLSASLLQGCNDSTPAQSNEAPAQLATPTEAVNMTSLATQVIYLDRSMLPPGAVVEVSLQDVSKVGGKADVLGAKSLTVQGGPPYALGLEYDAAKVKDNHRYSVRATIKLNDQLLYTSTEHLDPFAADAKQPLEITVQKVELHTAQAEFTNTYWKLITVAGQEVPSFEGAREQYVQFMTQDKQVRGFSGCNNFMGGYEVTGEQVTLTPLAGTRKMCVNGMEQEQAYLNAMAEVVSYSVAGETLTLKNAKGEAVASFESRYMN